MDMFNIPLTAMRRLLLLPLLLIPWNGNADAATLGRRMIVGQSGQTISVPDAPSRIADLWFAHTEIMVMLGAASLIAVTVERPASDPWVFRIAPQLSKAIQLSNTTPNAESLLAAGVDLAFAPSGSPAAPAARRVGIPVLEVIFTDVASLVRCVDLTADVLNTVQARRTASRYDAYLAEVIHDVRRRTDPIAMQARPRVLHIESLHPLKVDGNDTLIDTWINIAGGRNAAIGLSGNQKPVSVEQIAAWNPDVIIVGGKIGVFDLSQMGSLWQSVKAVREKKVFRNPVGVFSWDRYGVEFALQVQWAARLLHPALFRSTDMVGPTMQFYRDYFSYPLRKDEAQKIIDSQPPG